MTDQTTPRPWNWYFAGSAGMWVLRSDDEPVRLGGPPDIDLAKGDMGFVVRAVNAHDDLVKALQALILSAKILAQNAEGCAVNHYGEDFQLHGLPGWLIDCRQSIIDASSALEKAGKT